MSKYELLQGHVLDRLREMPNESVHCVVTSPPYWGLRDYGVNGQIGLEKTPQEFIAKLTEVFREVRRVLRSDGTCWVNMGDSYVASRTGSVDQSSSRLGGGKDNQIAAGLRPDKIVEGLPAKNLCGMPWRLAFALQEDGWWLRQDIIWSKPNPMPESVTDRCTKAHEYIFLLSKSATYFYDQDAIREPANGCNGSVFEDGKNLVVHPNTGKNRAHSRGSGVNPKAKMATVKGWATGATDHSAIAHNSRTAHPKSKQNPSFSAAVKDLMETRNKRSVWEIGTEAFPEAHFATFPTKLVEPCILAGSPVGGVVLDPFNGSGTTGVVALRLGRDYLGIELNPEYVAMAERRLSTYWRKPSARAKGTDADIAPLFAATEVL